MKKQATPITERSHTLSKNIDMLKAADILTVLSDCEDEIFGGYKDFKGVYDPGLITKCVQFAKKIHQDIQEHGKTHVVFVGAGTSGRLCRLMAKVLNPIVEDTITIIPIIAGGIKALVRAEPNTEDRAEEGCSDYTSYTKNIDRSHCFVIGISCGLSANYVRGALEEANTYSEGKTAIIGFNPVELATVQLDNTIQILNPIIGPEPIVGSVRMKGGTTTMILIYALIVAAMQNAKNARKIFIESLQNSQKTISHIRTYQQAIAQLVKRGNKTLRSGGSMYLVGDSHYGALCIYDAAECPPTFGANLTQVNGSSLGGVSDLVYFSGEEGEKMAKDIGGRNFIENIFPHVTESDMVIFIGNVQNDAQKSTIRPHLHSQNTFYIHVLQKGEIYEHVNNNTLHIKETWQNDFQKLLFVRGLLGQLSTGSFILSGKVYENKMIDMRITNKKLFLRAIRIIHDITHKDEATIQDALLKNIYEKDVPVNNNVEDHIAVSATKEHIVPLTILSLVYPEKRIHTLQSMLRKEPIVRKLIIEELQGFL